MVDIDKVARKCFLRSLGSSVEMHLHAVMTAVQQSSRHSAKPGSSGGCGCKEACSRDLSYHRESDRKDANKLACLNKHSVRVCLGKALSGNVGPFEGHRVTLRLTTRSSPTAGGSSTSGHSLMAAGGRLMCAHLLLFFLQHSSKVEVLPASLRQLRRSLLVEVKVCIWPRCPGFGSGGASGLACVRRGQGLPCAGQTLLQPASQWTRCRTPSPKLLAPLGKCI